MRLNGNSNTANWADYPGLGVDAQGIYLTGDMFSFNQGRFQYSKLRVLHKSEVYSFVTAHYHDFHHLKDITGQLSFTVQPAQTFGSSTAEFLVSLNPDHGSRLTLWSLTNPTAP